MPVSFVPTGSLALGSKLGLALPVLGLMGHQQASPNLLHCGLTHWFPCLQGVRVSGQLALGFNLLFMAELTVDFSMQKLFSQ